MALTKTLPASALKHADTITCKPKACPTCGQQECFERPRFFCGQLLTDKDLDAAQRYVIEKNKLHNRYLVGSGVVCGLAVRCDPCDGSVTIEPGYAIDCCGNDIVVCDAQRFDVLDYIKRCCREEEDGCEGKIQPPPSFCDDLPKEYCLVISYNELHTHPVTAMTRGNGCSTNRCEPSRTSEVFRFDLILPKDDDERERAPGNDFWSKARVCLADFLTISRKFFADLRAATEQQNHIALWTLFCRIRDDVLRHNRKGPNVRCDLRAELQAIEDQFPKVTEIPNYNALVYHAMFRMYGWLLQLTLDCICDALLVPCTDCSDEEGVLLACMTVRNGKIEKICNTARRQVLTGPALRYWLQPLYKGIGNLIDHICCELRLADVFDSIFRPPPPRTPGTVPGVSEDAAASKQQEIILAEGIERAAMRGETAMKLSQDYSPANKRGLRIANLMQFIDPNVVTALDLYQLTGYEASAKLLAIGCTVSERRAADDAEAYALGNLLEMAWVIEPQSKVQLLTIAPDDRVVAIRVR